MKLYVGQYSKLWRDYFDYFLQVIDSYQWKIEFELMEYLFKTEHGRERMNKIFPGIAVKK
jgi:hypothetical protein